VTEHRHHSLHGPSRWLRSVPRRSQRGRLAADYGGAHLLELHARIDCLGTPWGALADVVIDPLTQRVTHLVVQPRHRHSLARLVPIELVDRVAGPGASLSLRCTVDELRRMGAAQVSAFLRLEDFPLADPGWNVAAGDVLAHPYYGLTPLDLPGPRAYRQVSISCDRVPTDEVEIRRSSAVTSADYYRLGHVDGFLVDRDRKVTHMVLARGHVFGRREVAIPIGAVETVSTDTVTLRLSKADAAKLPTVPVRRWPRLAPT
jgi:hypothetical protein